jgi:co-chaperonin GroES (HSP10)
LTSLSIYRKKKTMSNTIALPPEGLILPPGVVPTKANAPTEEELATMDAIEKATQVPTPSGHKILCALVDATDKFDSGILKSEETKMVEELTSPVLFVIKLGVSAYKDKERFPDGPWCQEGDFVLTRPYTGTRIKIHGKEFRIINDDQVDGTVMDPRGISRV